MDIKLKQNLGRIIRTLEEQGMKPTKIAHSIGYTTTRQLYNSIEGQSMLSTKAIKGLIENLNVNPLYLFLGKGEMFLTDDSEIDTLRRENQEWIQRHNEAVKTVMALTDIIKKLEKKNDDLIELSSAAIKYHQGNKTEDTNKEVDSNPYNNTALKFLMEFGGREPLIDENGNIKSYNRPDYMTWLEKNTLEDNLKIQELLVKPDKK